VIGGALRAQGFPEDAIVVELDEVAAAERAIAWAGPDDVVLLLVHGAAARAALVERLRPRTG
jgi:UDP-N-acetylmuramyl tripeptide synthase